MKKPAATSIGKTIQNVLLWADKKGILESATSEAQAGKVIEEAREVLEEIRKNESKDAVAIEIGDVFVALTICAEMEGLSLPDCAQKAYEKIKNRTGKMVGGVFVKSEDLIEEKPVFTEFFQLETTTPGNTRKHPMVEARQAKTQRQSVFNRLKYRPKDSPLPTFPVRVTLTRLSSRKMDQHNLYGALKHCIDGVADAYGIDDGDSRWQWCVAQEVSKEHKVRGLKIEIERIGENENP